MGIDLSLIAVNHGTPGDVARLLQSLADHPPSCAVEMLVVNSIPEGAYASGASPYPCRVLAMDENRGYGAAVNRGVAEAKGEFLMAMNADILLRDDSLPRAVRYLRDHPRTGVLAPRLLSADGSPQQNARTYYTPWTILCRRTPLGRFGGAAVRRHLMVDAPAEAPVACDWALGAALMARRELLDGGRLFDERFFLYFEDVDLCARAWAKGYRVELVPEVTLVHAHRRESARNPLGPRGREHLRSLWRFWRKHGTLRPAGAANGSALREDSP